MRKLVSAALCCVLLGSCVAFAACSENSDRDTINALQDRIEQLEADAAANKTELAALSTTIQTLNTSIAALQSSGQANTDAIAVLETKVEALEGVSALYGQRLDALESSSDTYETDLTALQQDLSDLTDQVVNAQYIERIIVTYTDVTDGKSDLLSTLNARILNRSDDFFNIDAWMVFSQIPNYQLFCFKVTALIQNQEMYFNLYTDKGSRTDSINIRAEIYTGLPYDESNIVLDDKLYVVMYRFN